MTTIAWDGKTLAGDRKADRGGLSCLVETKVWKLADGRLYGGSGDWGAVLDARDILLRGESEDMGDYAGLFIELDGSCFVLDNKLRKHPAPWPFFAVGSGRDFAIMAMKLGRTAIEAVMLAAEFDTYSGGGITAVELA